MMRQSEFKKKYNPELGKYVKQHIYGEGIVDTLRSFFKPSSKSRKPPQPPKKVNFVPTTSSANKKSGDKIVNLLSRESPPLIKPARKLTQKDINNRLLHIMSGGKII